MKPNRVSIAGLMALVLLSAVGVAGLRSPSDLLASSLYSLTVAAVAIALVRGLATRGMGCIGYSVLGGAYLMTCFGPRSKVEPPPLATSALLEYLHPFANPMLRDGKGPVEVVQYFEYFEEPVKLYDATWSAPRLRLPLGVALPPVRRVDPAPYRQIGHCLAANVFGFLGAALGLFFASRGKPSAEPGGTS